MHIPASYYIPRADRQRDIYSEPAHPHTRIHDQVEDIMEFKRDLIFGIIHKLGANIVSVYHTNAPNGLETQINIKLDTTATQKDTAMKNTLRHTIEVVTEKGLEIIAINISGSLVIWDIMIVCRKVVGSCNAMHVLMNPSANITFTHGPDQRLSVETAVNHMRGTLTTLANLKNSLVEMAGARHAGYVADGPPVYNNGNHTIQIRESSNTTLSINLREDTDNLARQRTNYTTAIQSAIREVIQDLASTLHHAAGVQGLTAAINTKITLDIAHICTGGQANVLEATDEIRKKIAELCQALASLDKNLNRLIVRNTAPATLATPETHATPATPATPATTAPLAPRPSHEGLIGQPQLAVAPTRPAVTPTRPKTKRSTVIVSRVIVKRPTTIQPKSNPVQAESNRK